MFNGSEQRGAGRSDRAIEESVTHEKVAVKVVERVRDAGQRRRCTKASALPGPRTTFLRCISHLPPPTCSATVHILAAGDS